MRRRTTWTSLCLIVNLAAVLVLPAPSRAADEPPTYDDIAELMSEKRRVRKKAERRFLESANRSLVPGLVDALFFTPRGDRGALVEVLEHLTDADLGSDYRDWVEWIGAHEEIEPASGYVRWKRILFSRIDRRYGAVFFEGAPHDIRLEEIVWGGVRLDGIPSIDEPRLLAADEADYLDPDELVFGVSADGVHRAYPKRILSWHEMANDTLGERPIVLSYCSLCNSAIAFDAVPAGGRYAFGTSGLLYRSNKLMYDRQTYTLWNQLTGEPVVGRLARSPIRLEPLPVVVTSWEAWRARHPDTTVIALEPERGREHGFDYRPGAADLARRGVSFPVWQASDALREKTAVYGIRIDDAAKAYPVERLAEAGVVNDRVGGTPVVVVASEDAGVRVYEREERTFTAADGGTLRDETEQVWEVREEALVPANGGTDAATEGRLPRIPGHEAYWFGWYGFFPDTEIYE